MTRTATPINPDSSAYGLYELDPLMVVNGHPVRYVTILALRGIGGLPARTRVYAADIDGAGDAEFYMKHGPLAEYMGFDHPGMALTLLGYDAPELELVG